MVSKKITPKATYGMSTEKDHIVPVEGAKLKIKQAPTTILVKKVNILPKAKVEVEINK